ncbi:hypothetical protein J1C56_08965 [Aminobacter anthyllidis]|uniref:Uncharacterized protein n=1 Tax=Aminobacter anthyllidis TaxID=1035067 RepID=A0A9X1A9A5_9HYPH|nr:hypothetical protein [Aminobacter anthyllidis]MBT1155721.1 hypothetical protein [Aminobacter anthyllidis]
MSDQKHFGMDIDMKMSLGNMIVIGTLLASIIFGWANFRSDIEANRLATAANTTRIERLEIQSGEMKDRLTRMEVTLQNVSMQIDRAVRLLEKSGNPTAP